jgi:hypothetical protein
MKLIYNNKEILLKECRTFWTRFKGFMLCKEINRALLFNHCNSIHTFFMYKDIDVIMCNKDNIILYYYKNLSKNKVIFPKKGVSIVYETPPEYFKIKINDKMEVKK